MNAASLAAPQTLNLYAYCANDPINHLDPSGLGFWSFLKKLFHWFNKILKWVVLAVVVVTIAIAVVVSPEAAIVFAKAVLGFIGKIMGISVTQSAAIITDFAGEIVGISVSSSISMGVSGYAIAGFYAVGAVSSFAQTKPRKKKRNLTPQQILIKVNSIVKAALAKKDCRDYISDGGDPMLDKDARVTFRRFVNKRENYQMINEGQNNPANPQNAAQGGIDNDGGVRKPTIRLWKPFFSDNLTLNTHPGAGAGLSKFDWKALAELHELKHVYSGGAPPSHDNPGGWNDELIKRCF
jgi:hypothetical protein